MLPRISIAMPVLNGSNFVSEAVRSVLAQTHCNFEFVISDNCSDDETLRIVSEMTSGDSRVVISQPEVRLSQPQHVNRAVGLCHGEWVKVLCHDDLLDPPCLARLIDATENIPSTVGLIGHGERWLFANGEYELNRSSSGELTVVDGKKWLGSSLNGTASVHLPALSTSLVRRQAWESSGGFDDRYRHFDIFLWSKLMMNWDFAHLGESLSVTRIHGAQVAVDARKTLQSAFEAQDFWSTFVDEHGDELSLGRAVRLRNRLRGPSAAGTALAVELLRRRPGSAAKMVGRLPLRWWPLLPPLTTRAYRREAARIRTLRDRVPVRDIYP